MGQGDIAGFEWRWGQPDSVFEHLREEFGLPDNTVIREQGSMNSKKKGKPFPSQIPLLATLGFPACGWWAGFFKIPHARFFELPLGKEEPIILEAGFFRKLRREPPAIPVALPVNHGVEIIRPLGLGRAEITMTDRRGGGDLAAQVLGSILGHPPDHHGVSPEARNLMAKNGAEAADHAAAHQIMDAL
jgi:hypothetical protein